MSDIQNCHVQVFARIAGNIQRYGGIGGVIQRNHLAPPVREIRGKHNIAEVEVFIASCMTIYLRLKPPAGQLFGSQSRGVHYGLKRHPNRCRNPPSDDHYFCDRNFDIRHYVEYFNGRRESPSLPRYLAGELVDGEVKRLDN